MIHEVVIGGQVVTGRKGRGAFLNVTVIAIK